MESCSTWPFEIGFSLSLNILPLGSLHIVWASTLCSCLLLRVFHGANVEDPFETEGTALPSSNCTEARVYAPGLQGPGCCLSCLFLIPCPSPSHPGLLSLLKPTQLVPQSCSLGKPALPLHVCQVPAGVSPPHRGLPSATLHKCCHPPIFRLSSSLALIISGDNFLCLFYLFSVCHLPLAEWPLCNRHSQRNELNRVHYSLKENADDY